MIGVAVLRKVDHRNPGYQLDYILDEQMDTSLAWINRFFREKLHEEPMARVYHGCCLSSYPQVYADALFVPKTVLWWFQVTQRCMAPKAMKLWLLPGT